MSKQETQYVKNKDSPLISIVATDRYTKLIPPTAIQYELLYPEVPDYTNHKNTVLTSNLERENEVNRTGRIWATVQNERTKSLVIKGQGLNVHERWTKKHSQKQATYYTLNNEKDMLNDTYYSQKEPIIPRTKIEKPFSVPVNPDSLGLFAERLKVPLSHELTNTNNRLVKNKNDLKGV